MGKIVNDAFEGKKGLGKMILHDIVMNSKLFLKGKIANIYALYTHMLGTITY